MTVSLRIGYSYGRFSRMLITAGEDPLASKVGFVRECTALLLAVVLLPWVASAQRTQKLPPEWQAQPFACRSRNR
jgi:hypothetical protein